MPITTELLPTTLQMSVKAYADFDHAFRRAQRLIELASTTLTNSDGRDDHSTVIDLLDLVVEQMTEALAGFDVARTKTTPPVAVRPRRRTKGGGK
jgi:hypothetical protein